MQNSIKLSEINDDESRAPYSDYYDYLQVTRQPDVRKGKGDEELGQRSWPGNLLPIPLKTLTRQSSGSCVPNSFVCGGLTHLASCTAYMQVQDTNCIRTRCKGASYNNGNTVNNNTGKYHPVKENIRADKTQIKRQKTNATRKKGTL